MLFFLLLPYFSPHPTAQGALPFESPPREILSTVHFDIYFPDGLETLAIRTAQIAESAYIRVSSYLQHDSTGVIPIFLASPGGGDHACHFIHRLPAVRGAAGGRYSAYPIHAEFDGSYSGYRRRLTHAMVHSFQLDILADGGKTVPLLSSLRLPLWIAEGMAEYIAGGGDHPCRQVNPSCMDKNQDARLKYSDDSYFNHPLIYRAAGYSFCSFIEQRYGKELFGGMIRDFRDLGYMDDVIRAGTGKSMEVVDEEWVEFMRSAAHDQGNSLTGSGVSYIAREDSAMNHLVAAVSPDGAMIAYMSEKDGLPLLKVARYGRGAAAGGRTAATLIDAGGCVPTVAVRASGNSPAWSNDGRTIIMASGRGIESGLLFADAGSGRITARILLPFAVVLNPSVSRNGRYIAFSGVAGSAEDLYLYDRSDGTLVRLSDDSFSDRCPVFMPDGKSVVFASNWNREGDIFRGNYSLYLIDIATGTRTKLAGGESMSALQPDISPDGKKMLYVSDATGTNHVWLYDFTTKRHARLTDSAGGADYPRWLPDGRRFVVSVYRDRGFELRINEIGTAVIPGNDVPSSGRNEPAFPAVHVPLSGDLFRRYGDGIRPEHLRINAEGSTGGSSVYARLDLSDMLSRHRLRLASNYMRESKQDDLSASLSYRYAAGAWDLGCGIFRQAGPLDAMSLETGNGPAEQPGAGRNAGSAPYYGGALGFSYTFFRHVTFAIRIEAGGHQQRFKEYEMRNDHAAGLGTLTASLEYDSLLRGAMVPVRGLWCRMNAEQTIGLDRGNTFTGLAADIRYYAHPDKHCIVMLRGAGGTRIGSAMGDITYHIGGYASLRGFDLLSLSGNNMFFFNAELWLTPGDWRLFGMPLSGPSGSIGFVLFIDAGAAWTGSFSLLDKSGRFDDLKIDFGFGIRAAISPVLFLKLDFACPFDKKSFKENKILFSMGFDY